MQSFFPTASALSATFGHATPYNLKTQTPAKRSPYLARSNLYPSWDVAEDAKNKAAGLSDAATKELQKASEIAQAKAGKIELYSGKYYAVRQPSTIGNTEH
jgi:solute carrier family 25 phosphate transporter 3